MSELAPQFRQQFFDNNGLPLSGGFVYSYVAGTTTPLATYTDQSGVTPNTNPIVLDSSGTAAIWMANASYKFVVEDSLGNVLETVDNVLSTAEKIAAAVNVAGALDILNNLSDVNNAQTSLNNLVGTQTSGKYLRSDGTNVSLSTIQSGDIPSLGTNVVTNSNLAQMASNTLKGNNSGSTANAADLTVTQVKTMLNTLTNPMAFLGDMIYEDATPAPARVAGNATTTKMFLSETGTGSVAAAPVWGTIAAADVPTLNQNTTGTAANVTGTTNATLTTLSALTTASSLTSVGTIGTGTWNATTIGTAKGGTGQTSVIVAPAASTYAGWDANKNLSANALLAGFTTTATAAQTITMTIASTETQYATGTTTIIYKLPTTSIAAGAQYLIENRSTGVATVQSSGANTITTLSANTGALFTALIATPTTAANWDFVFTPSIVGSTSGNVWTSTGATSAPTWQAPGAASVTTGLVVSAHVAAWSGGTPSGEWATSGGSTLSAFTANTSAPANTLDISFTTWGTAQTANSNLPQITVNSLVAGSYKVTATFMTDYQNSGIVQTYALSDGTTTVGHQMMITGGTEPAMSLIGVFKYTTTANITFSIFGQASTGNPQIYMASSASQTPRLNWIIEKVN